MRPPDYLAAVLARTLEHLAEAPSIEPYLTDLYADSPETCRAGLHPFAAGSCAGCAQLRSRRSYQARLRREVAACP